MIDKIKKAIEEVKNYSANNPEDLEQFRLKYLSKKGLIADFFSNLKEVQAERRKEVGQQLNELKNAAQSKIEAFRQAYEQVVDASATQTMDLTAPCDCMNMGSRHPISLVKTEICNIFEKIGFSVVTGPEIEDDWHLFSALNFPPEHPARDMQDTFFVEQNPDVALRTHTSSIQVRVMEHTQPPIRVVCPGRVFRNEAITARAHCIFHQVEGLYIDKNVSFADLKQTLLYFAKEMFGNDTKIRLRPSYFPFTEPSAEMDISCDICGGKGCNLCKNSGWVEILGCGMVDPNVLDNCGIDSKVYSGFAFGMGVERITQQKYKTKDIRLFFENDIRFLQQFEAE